MLHFPHNVFMCMALLKHGSIYEKDFSQHFLILKVLLIYFLKNVSKSSNTLFRRLKN